MNHDPEAQVARTHFSSARCLCLSLIFFCKKELAMSNLSYTFHVYARPATLNATATPNRNPLSIPAFGPSPHYQATT